MRPGQPLSRHAEPERLRNTIRVAYHVDPSWSYAPAAPSAAARSRDVQAGVVRAEVVARDRVFEGAAAGLEAGASAASVAWAECRAGEAGVAAVLGGAVVP
ncbi:hypothetical protein [Streptomyces sp. NPDC005209]|uniref:hypothetical protein n=1 Tax=Streptomyces sp. NPDC005209 TaxID=3156715 RepID=UPI0033BAFE16